MSTDVFVREGEELFCVSDMAEMVSLSACCSGGEMSDVEVIVEVCSDIDEFVDILTVFVCRVVGIRFVDFSPFRCGGPM